MIEKEIKFIIQEYESNSCELSYADNELIIKAKEAAKRAYCPYSHFFVGAALRLENGEIITGNNQENAAYPSGLCAERVALFYANALFPNVSVESLAVCAFTNDHFVEMPIPPCGACRQVILETENRFRKPIRIILAGEKTIQIIPSAKILLPLNFDESFLK